MDIRAYIASGIIEDYCLGVLSEEECKAVEEQAQRYSKIKQEIESFMQALKQYALECADKKVDHLRDKTLNLLDNLKLEHEANINALPLLNKYADHKNWLRIVKPLLPEKLDRNMFVRELRNETNISQTLIWTSVDYPDEVHDNVEECFIILEGKCRCYVEDEVIELSPGGFLEIPMYKHHDVQVLEHPVLAVVQRVKVA